MHKDGLYIDWHLLSGLNHNTLYSREPESAANEEYVREPLLDAAYRLLSLNRPEYIIHLYGGEPSIHPYFQELFNYLATSGRNTHIILDTNGLRGSEYFASLLRNAPLKEVCVNLDVHLKHMDLQNLLYMVATIAAKGQFCNVFINYVDEYSNKAELFCQKLASLRKNVPFSLGLRFPLGGAAAWLPKIQTEFNNAKGPILELPDWTKPQPVEPFAKKKFACFGINAVYVNSEGFCSLGLAKDDQPFSPVVMRNAPLRPGMPAPLLFDREDAALKYLADFRLRAIHYAIDGGMARHPWKTDIDAEQKLRSALKYTQPAQKKAGKIKAFPDLMHLKSSEILTALTALTDETSRQVFLRRLKAQLYGDSAYLIDSDENLPNAAANEGDNYPRFEKINNVESLSSQLAGIQWRQSSFELILPDNSDWLDSIFLIKRELPEYKISLAQREMSTILFAEPASSVADYMPLTTEKNFISIILAATVDANALESSLKSVLDQNLSFYEVILVMDVNCWPVFKIANDYIKSSAWKIRPLYVDASLDLGAAWNAGLKMAQGNYIVFLRCGDALKQDILAPVIEDMVKTNAEIAIFSPAYSEQKILSGPTALEKFLSGEDGSVSNKIYGAALIREKNLSFINLPDQLEDPFFNLPILRFANKILAIPGMLIYPRLDPPVEDSRQIYDAFVQICAKMALFCKVFGFDQSEFRPWVFHIFQKNKAEISKAISFARSQNILDELLSDKTLITLANTGGFVEHLCSSMLPPTPFTSSEKFPEAAEGAIYNGVSSRYTQDWPLTVVISVQKESDTAYLEQIFLEDYSLLECVIIDNNSDSRTGERLRYFADIQPNVRLYRFNSKVSQAICGNKGIELSRGAMIFFMPGGNELATGLPVLVSSIVKRQNPDVIVFDANFDNTAAVSPNFGDIMAAYFSRLSKLENLDLMFNRAYLNTHNIRFNPSFADSIIDFILRALENAKYFISAATPCFHHNREDNSHVEGYENPTLFFDMYALLQKAVEHDKWASEAAEGLREWLTVHLRKSFLPVFTGMANAGSLPNIKLPPVILRSLLTAYAETVQ